MAQGQQQQEQSQEEMQQTFVYDENFHPLDFNKDNNVDILDAQLGAQLFGEPTALMVTKYIQNENPFDYNNDGFVDVNDILLATQSGVAPHIIHYMQQLVMNPPYDPEPTVQMNGSSYHPLDINQDGNVDVSDLVVLGTSNIPETARPVVAGMIQKYALGQNPYDINQDGSVDVLDILHAINVGVPQNILQDMQNNLLTQTPPLEPEPIEPGLHEHLYSSGEFADALKLLRFRGPIHKEVFSNGKEVYFTGATKMPTRRLLVLIESLQNPNLVREPEGMKPNNRPFLSNGGGQY